MMPEYDNRNTFTLFRNTKKRDGKRDPDFTGKFTDIDGNQYFLDAWSQTPKNGGDKFLSGKVKMMEKQEKFVPRPAPQQRVQLEDDVPFGAEFR
jgi:hypothetical protein